MSFCIKLVIPIAKCQRAKMLPIRARCSICWEISWITVIYKKHGYSCRIRPLEFFKLFLSLKTIKNSSGQMRQLYMYVANESTRRLVEDGMNTGLTNTRHGLLILCSVSRVRSKTMHSLFCNTSKSYLTLPYVTSLRDSFCLELSRTALLSCRPAPSCLREATRWQQTHCFNRYRSLLDLKLKKKTAALALKH